MAFFAGLDDDMGVRGILQLNRPAGKALIELHEAVMRQPSALSAAERELIAAYVSGLNACTYCFGVHAEVAKAYGVPAARIAALLDDIDASDVEDRLKPIFKFARTATLTPARVVQADVDAILAAGWPEQAVHDALQVCCLYNFMNRLLDGHGVHSKHEVWRTRGQGLMQGGYAPLLKALGY